MTLQIFFPNEQCWIVLFVWTDLVWPQVHNLTKIGYQKNTENLLTDPGFMLETSRLYAWGLRGGVGGAKSKQ